MTKTISKICLFDFRNVFRKIFYLKNKIYFYIIILLRVLEQIFNVFQNKFLIIKIWEGDFVQSEVMIVPLGVFVCLPCVTTSLDILSNLVCVRMETTVVVFSATIISVEFVLPGAILLFLSKPKLL